MVKHIQVNLPSLLFPCPHTHPNWFIALLRLVFTSDGVRVKVRVVSGVVRVLMTRWQSKIWVVSRVIRSLRSSKNRIVRVGTRKKKQKDKPIIMNMCPCFVIGLVLLLPLVTLTTQFSLDRKWRCHNQNIRMLFSLDFKVLCFWLRLWLRLRC